MQRTGESRGSVPVLGNLEVRATVVERPGCEHGSDRHSTVATSVRTVEHCGHRIEVTTTYEFKIDGRPVTGHFVVNDAGKVLCHDLPNYAFSSALGLAKRLVDLIGSADLKDELNPAGQPSEPCEEDAGHMQQGGD